LLGGCFYSALINYWKTKTAACIKSKRRLLGSKHCGAAGCLFHPCAKSRKIEDIDYSIFRQKRADYFICADDEVILQRIANYFVSNLQVYDESHKLIKQVICRAARYCIQLMLFRRHYYLIDRDTRWKPVSLKRTEMLNEVITCARCCKPHKRKSGCYVKRFKSIPHSSSSTSSTSSSSTSSSSTTSTLSSSTSSSTSSSSSSTELVYNNPIRDHPDYKVLQRKIKTRNEEYKLIEAKNNMIYDNIEEEMEKYIFNTECIAENERRCIIITGSGGVGKTYLIKKIIELANAKKLNESEMVCTATTGVAADSIGKRGRILHEYFGIFNEMDNFQDAFNKIQSKDSLCKRILSLRYLIIDECSMLGAAMLDFLDKTLRIIRSDDSFMGGVKLILVGDIFQLPPVNDKYFFYASCWESEMETSLRVFYLTKTYRFNGSGETTLWSELLSRVRRNCVNESDIDFLNEHTYGDDAIAKMQSYKPEEQGVVLLPRRSSSNSMSTETYNATILLQSNNRKYRIEAITHDKRTEEDKIKYDIEEKSNLNQTLEIMIGLRVMMTSNHLRKKHGIFNGKTGEIIAAAVNDKEHVISIDVKFDGIEKPITIKRIQESFCSGRYRRRQFPLIACAAVTIHKSQSLSLTKAAINLDSIFAAGQAYTALSRIRDPKGLFLMKFNPACIFARRDALMFDLWMMKHSAGKTDENISDSFNPNEILNSNFVNIRDFDGACMSIREHAAAPNLILKNTVFYDLETFKDQKHSGDIMNEEIPYFNFAMHYNNGNLVAARTQNLFDRKYRSRTDDFKLWETNNFIIAKDFFDWIINIIEEQNHAFIKQKKQFGNKHRIPLTVCAYNGGNFDFHFFLKCVLKNKKLSEEYKPQITMKGSDIVLFQLFHKASKSICLRTHDICAVIKMPLAKAAKEFLGDAGLSKGVFPHLWLSRDKLNLVKQGSTVKVDMADFPKSMRKIVQKKVESGQLDLDHFDFYGEVETYGPLDVQILRDVYLAADKIMHDYIKTSIMKFNTAAAVSYYGFMTHLPAIIKQPSTSRSKRRRNMYEKTRYQIYRFSISEDEETSSAILGGKCYPRISSFLSKDYCKPYDEVEDTYYYLDIKSMYVTAMQRYPYMWGVHEFMSKESHPDILNAWEIKLKQCRHWEDIRDHENPFFMKITYEHHASETEPLTAIKKDNKLHWTLHKRTDWKTWIDIALLIKNRATIHAIEKICIWPRKYPIFRKWIEKTFAGKKKAEIEGLNGLKRMCKDWGNSTYGVMLRKDFSDCVVMVNSIEQLESFHQKYNWLDSINGKEWMEESKEQYHLILKGERKQNDETKTFDISNRPHHIAATVLAYSRLMLEEILDVINPFRHSGTAASLLNMVLYGDTDSIMARKQSVPRLIEANLIGEDLGQLGDELCDNAWNAETKQFRGAKIVKYFGSHPKSYAVRAMLPPEYITDEIINSSHDKWKTDKKGNIYLYDHGNLYREIVKMKGINLKDFSFDYGGKHYEHLSLDMMEEIHNETKNKNAIIIATMKDRIQRCGINLSQKERAFGLTCFSIKRSDISRQFFKTIWTGRKPVFEGSRFLVPNDWSWNLNLTQDQLEKEIDKLKN